MIDQLYVTHDANDQGRDYVVGDLHGQLEAFESALALVNFDKRVDRCFAVGDLVDRGKDSFACLQFSFEDWFHCTLGNHEILMLNALAANATDSEILEWIRNGGAWMAGENQAELRSLAFEAARYWPLAREISVAGKRVGICHAEPPLNWQNVRDNPNAYREQLTSGRTRFKTGDERNVQGIDAVVVGHSIQEQVTRLGNVVNIDTGAYLRSGSLTLVAIEDMVP